MAKLTRRDFVKGAVAGGVALAATGSAKSADTAPTRPNILIVMTDHQRADTVLAEHPCRTPNLDAFAKQAVTFTHTFCPSPHCCPSRATFFTGLYPSRHGVWNNICNDQALSRGIHRDVRTFGEDLADAGYNTVFCGKWHVSIDEMPADRGWTQTFHLSAAQPRIHGLSWEQIEKRHREIVESDARARGEGEILRPGYGTYRAYRSRGEARGNGQDDNVTDAAVAALPKLAAAGKPWALYVGLIGPHDPYNVPQRYLDLYDIQDVPLPPSFADDLADKPRVYKRMRDTRWNQLGELEFRQAIRHFWAYCTYLDDLFGQVLAALDATGQADNTVVLYTSDHGDYCGDHGLFCKGIPAFRGAYNVPAMIRWPAGLARPGRREDALVTLADFAPTFTELCGKPAPADLTGRSLAPFLRGQRPADWPDEVHSQCNGVEVYYTQRSVSTKDFKYVYNAFDNDELYDLRADPHEMKNLADDRAYRDVVRQMCRRMWRFAYREKDVHATGGYITVALAPFGPAEAFAEEG